MLLYQFDIHWIELCSSTWFKCVSIENLLCLYEISVIASSTVSASDVSLLCTWWRVMNDAFDELCELTLLKRKYCSCWQCGTRRCVKFGSLAFPKILWKQVRFLFKILLLIDKQYLIVCWDYYWFTEILLCWTHHFGSALWATGPTVWS